MCRRRRNGPFQNMLYPGPMYGNAMYAPGMPFSRRPGSQDVRRAIVGDIIGVIVSRCQQPQGYYPRPPPQVPNGYGYGHVQGGYYQGPGNWNPNPQRVPQPATATVPHHPAPSPTSQQAPVNGRHHGLESKSRSKHEHGKSSGHGGKRHHHHHHNHRSESREDRTHQWVMEPISVKQEEAEVWEDWSAVPQWSSIPRSPPARRNPDEPPSYEDVMMNRV
ncbi:hypothetical protein F5884DRAFT_753641 [Xylogone sp. PMI_703]|nr:hypothetical protein F5884DRAFT_753641 [Xylogone sp. PMI_703]